MKSVLLCHFDDELSKLGLSRWMSSYSNLAGIILIRENPGRTKQRIRAELRRVGALRLVFDILPYRLFSRLFFRAKEKHWIREKLEELKLAYPSVDSDCEVLICSSPNDSEVISFLERLSPTFMLARCKTLLRSTVFDLPKIGTFVLHPGICPEYRNAHGCFWALANGDIDKVGATLLRIDAGVDTGPIFGYFTCKFDIKKDIPSIIQLRVVYDNLSSIAEKIEKICDGTAQRIETGNRKSAVWGQPWLSRYLKVRYFK